MIKVAAKSNQIVEMPPQRGIMANLTASLVVLGLFLILSACQPIYRNHGYVPTEAELVLVEVGRDTQETVAAAVGRPSAQGLLNEVGWFYVKSRYQTRGLLARQEIDRQVVVISFDDKGVVANIERFGLEKGRIVALSRRVTTSNVDGRGFLNQLFGNIGDLAGAIPTAGEMTVNPDSMGILTGEWRLSHGGVSLRCATDPGDLLRISYLRDQSFGAAPSGKAALDPFDDQSQHLFVESLHDKRILAACRVRFHADVASACQGYTGQFYDLADLGRIGFPLLELGRLCTLRPAGGQSEGQAAALRLIWAGLADLVRLWGAKAIFGCASFPAADRLFHLAALGQLAAVNRDALGQRLCARVDPALRVALDVADPKSATVTLPPLLRSYLSLGAWVGPDAVLDHELDTLHVLTVLQIDRVPPARRAAMAAFVASIGGQPVDGPLQSA